jgi:hypothetical protein
MYLVNELIRIHIRKATLHYSYCQPGYLSQVTKCQTEPPRQETTVGSVTMTNNYESQHYAQYQTVVYYVVTSPG